MWLTILDQHINFDGFNQLRAKLLVVVTLPLPWNETIIQDHAANQIKFGWEKSGNPFRTSHECKLLTGSPTTNKVDCHW